MGSSKMTRLQSYTKVVELREANADSDRDEDGSKAKNVWAV